MDANDSAWRPHERDPVLPREELLDRLSQRDLAVLGILPTIAVLVFLWPGRPDGLLVLSRSDPSPLAALTTHYVHRSVGHLLSNLIAYLLVVPTTYGLALVAGRRRSFLIGFGLLAVVAPPAVAGFDLLAFDSGVVFGFSGVAMAFAGFLPVELAAFAGDRFGLEPPSAVAAGLFFAGLGVIATLVVPPPSSRLPIVLLAAVFAAAFLRRSGALDLLDREARSAVRRGDLEFAAVGVGVFLVVLLMGFTGGARSAGVIVNTYGHLLGFVVGFAVPYGLWIGGGSETIEALEGIV